MNKTAPKEPSMDEILSSIRQIIADDDAAAAAPRRPSPAVAPVVTRPPAAQAQPVPPAIPTFREVIQPAAALDEEDEPLVLSSEQMLAIEDEADEAVPTFATFADDDDSDGDDAREAALQASFIDPDDVGFEADPEPQPIEPPAPVFRPSAVAMPKAPPYVPPPAARVAPALPPLRPRPTAAEAAPMPDSRLSADIAEQLLEPATNAAVRSTFSKLSNMGLGNSTLTIEALMRDMLRPMLKDWLDENLPSVVERMVEKEIARISRGGL